VHYPRPLNQQAAYEGRCRGNATPHAREVAARVLSLPMSADLSVDDQQRVVQSLLA
jgi:UDP-2-acetamido-2-deoxy-ribo-hexuluronate aminotransferase